MKLKEEYRKCKYCCSVEEAYSVLKHNLFIKHLNNYGNN